MNRVRTINIPLIANFLHFSSKKIIVECLQNRGILRVNGREVESFMQGLMTNDMRHLSEGAASMYTMFLNTKGRVLYDAIIYKQKEAEDYLIECDKESLLPLQKHLKMYRVRRRINVEILENDYKLWVAFNPNVTEAQNPLVNAPIKDLDDFSNILKGNSYLVESSKGPYGLHIFRDPRLLALGLRLIAKPELKPEEILKYIGGDIATLATATENYRSFRYKLGIGEGVHDLPPGECFPLEANCDYLHGVSFHKGCYIGQELTARVHHTGVVRKRLMPLLLNSTPAKDFPVNTLIKISSDAKNSIGKLRGIEGSTGLALLRVVPALEADLLKIEETDGRTMKPTWWPIEAPKEKMSLPKTD